MEEINVKWPLCSEFSVKWEQMSTLLNICQFNSQTSAGTNTNILIDKA